MVTQLTVVSDNTDVALYDRMCKAIAECHRIDEVKEIRDKAIALAEYSRQAKDKTTQRLFNEIKLRAERKAGELISKLPKGSGGDKKSLRDRSSTRRKNDTETKVSVLEGNKVSVQTANAWEKSAAIPKDEFEAEVKKPNASTKRLADYAKVKEPSWKKPTPKWKPEVDPHEENQIKLLEALRRISNGLKTANFGKGLVDDVLEMMKEQGTALPQSVLYELKLIKEQLGVLISFCPCPFRNADGDTSGQSMIRMLTHE
jgi:hypothetical protein